MKNAFIWSFLGQYVTIMMRAASVIVVARVLSPNEIGIYAIAASVIALTHGIRNMGINQFLIRENDLTKQDYQAVLFISWSLCFTLFAVINIFAVSIAEFYENSSIENILRVLTVSILILPLGLISESMIVKEMRFKVLALINGVNSVLNLTITVVLALNDFGAISLAIATLVGQISMVILFKYYANTDIPAMPKLKNVRVIAPKVLKVGSSQLINLIGQQGQPLYIGKSIGAEAVALYDKGFALINLMNELIFSAIQKVMLPIFSLHTKEGTNPRDSYLQVTSVILSIAWPALVFFYLYAEQIIVFLYGEQWRAASVLVPYFTVIASINNITRFHNELMIGLKRDKEVFYSNLIYIGLNLSAIVYFSQFGLEKVVWSLQFVSIVRLIINTYNITYKADIAILETLKVLRNNLLLAVFVSSPLVITFMMGSNPIKVLGVFISAIFWLLMAYIFKHPIMKLVTK